MKINDEEIKLQIWDTAGQEKYKSITKSYIEKADGILLAFDLTNKLSFKTIENWKSQVESFHLNIKLVLVGTKADLVNERAISKEECQRKSQELKIEYFETSSKDNYNVTQAFETLASNIYQNLIPSRKKNSMKLNDSNIVKDKKKDCC